MSQQINLFNPVLLKQKKHFSFVTMLQALGMLLAVVVAFYGYAGVQTRELARQAQEAEKQYAQLQARLVKATADFAPQKTDAGLVAEIGNLQSQASARQAMIGSLGAGVLSNDTGYAEYMRALARQSLGGVWLTGFKISEGGVQMEIAGRALQPELVPSYILRLNRERVLRGRAFDALSMTQKQAALPAAAAPRPAGAPTTYTFTEFQFASSHAQLPEPQASVQAGAAPAANEAPAAPAAPPPPAGAAK